MSKEELTLEQQKELQKLAEEILDDAKKVVKDYKDNPSNLDETNCVEVHEDSPYLMEKHERNKMPTYTSISGSANIEGSFKLHEL